MLIIIGADGNTLDSRLAKRFGHAAYYILYNTYTKEFSVDANAEEEHHHENLFAYIENGVEAFIAGNVGPHAFEIMNTPRSKVYLARKMSVEESVQEFLKGGLQQLTEPTVKKKHRA